MTRFAFLVLLASCVHLAHVNPQPRSLTDAQRAAVRIEVNCTEEDLQTGENIDWKEVGYANGVLI